MGPLLDNLKTKIEMSTLKVDNDIDGGRKYLHHM